MKTLNTFFAKLPKGMTTETEIRKVLKPLERNPQFTDSVRLNLKRYKPSLPYHEAHEQLIWLRKLCFGNSKVKRRDQPFSDEQIAQLEDAISVRVVDLHKGELCLAPIYEILMIGNEPGFKFTRKEPNPIIK